MSGKNVILSSSDSSVKITPPISATNASGKASATISSTSLGIKTLSATDSTDNITLTNTATVTFTVGSVSSSKSTISVFPEVVLANNSSTASITVKLMDNFENAISGKTVSLSASGTGNTTISPGGSLVTNDSGQADFTIRSDKAGKKTLTARTGDKVIYSGASTPSQERDYRFEVKSKMLSGGGALTLLKNQPAIFVSNASDGSGEVTLVSQPETISAGNQSNQLIFTYKPTGTIINGELTLAIPVADGWSRPQLKTNQPGAISFQTMGGSIGTASIEGENVVKVPIKNLLTTQSLTI